MTVVARRVAAVPARTSTDTWRAIVALLTADSDPARRQLEAVTNLVAMLIAEEYTAQAPIVVVPAVGDRVRIYTVRGEAVDDVVNEQPLASWPLQAQGWSISLPCGEDDLADASVALDAHPGFSARDLTAAVDVGVAESNSRGRAGGQPLVVDLGELRRS
jgi:hypothetical protein